MNGPMDAELFGVYVRKESDKGKHLATVHFAYRHSGFKALEIKRDYKSEGSDDWKSYVTAEIRDGWVKLQGRLYEGKDGPFVSGGWQGVPREVLTWLSQESLRSVHDRMASSA